MRRATRPMNVVQSAVKEAATHVFSNSILCFELGAICIRQVQKHGVGTSSRVKHQRPVHGGRLPRSPKSEERRLDGTR